MSLGASEYAVGMAQNSHKYIANLLKKEAVFGPQRAQIVADLCRKTDQSLFTFRLGKRSVLALQEHFKIPKRQKVPLF